MNEAVEPVIWLTSKFKPVLSEFAIDEVSAFNTLIDDVIVLFINPKSVIWVDPDTMPDGSCSELDIVPKGRLAIVWAELLTVPEGRLAIVWAELLTVPEGNTLGSISVKPLPSPSNELIKILLVLLLLMMLCIVLILYLHCHFLQ